MELSKMQSLSVKVRMNSRIPVVPILAPWSALLLWLPGAGAGNLGIQSWEIDID